MTYQHKNTVNAETPAGPVTSSATSYTAGQHAGISATLTGGSTTDFPNCAVDVSQAVSVVMKCDRDVTITANDDGSPDATINLKAGVPLIWTNDGYFATPLGVVDWTTVRAVLAAGADAPLVIDIIYD